MATAEQVKALLKSHAARDDTRFYSTALQMAAREARQGHHKLANEIKELVEKFQKTSSFSKNNDPIVSLVQTSKTEIGGLLDEIDASVHFNELVLSDEISDRLKQVLFEQKQKDLLSTYGLISRRKLLFTGPPGTGKTMSAIAIATALDLPLFTVVLDSLITRYMGETAVKLRLIFDHIKQVRAVYLFDEFDAIGTQRGAQNDVGEIRRVLNSFLMFVEQDVSESIVIAATNHPELLDKALYRRFDDIILFEKPAKKEIINLIQNRLAIFKGDDLDWFKLSDEALGLSSAEVTRACEDAAKDAVLYYDANLSTDLVLKAIKRRQLSK